MFFFQWSKAMCHIKYNMYLYVWSISATVLIPLILGNNTLIHCLEIQLQIYRYSLPNRTYTRTMRSAARVVARNIS